MVKKINEDAMKIKKLLEKGLSQKQISKLLGLKKQKVSYWANHDMKTIPSRRKKLPLPFINKICNLAKDRTTSDMG